MQTGLINGEVSLGESEYDGASTGCKQVGQQFSQQQFTSNHADPSSFGPWMQFNRSMGMCNGVNIIQLTILHQSTFKHNVLPKNSKLLLIETFVFVSYWYNFILYYYYKYIILYLRVNNSYPLRWNSSTFRNRILTDCKPKFWNLKRFKSCLQLTINSYKLITLISWYCPNTCSFKNCSYTTNCMMLW